MLISIIDINCAIRVGDRKNAEKKAGSKDLGKLLEDVRKTRLKDSKAQEDYGRVEILRTLEFKTVA